MLFLIRSLVSSNQIYVYLIYIYIYLYNENEVTFIIMKKKFVFSTYVPWGPCQGNKSVF